MRKIPLGVWTEGRSVAVELGLSCPPVREVEDSGEAVNEAATVDGVPPAEAASLDGSIRMTVATSVAVGATMLGTAAVTDGQLEAEHADVKDPAAEALDRVHASCAPVPGATAAGHPVAVAVTRTVAADPELRRSVIGPQLTTARSAAARANRRDVPSRRLAPEAAPERPGPRPGPVPDRTVATEIHITIKTLVQPVATKLSKKIITRPIDATI